MWTPKRVLLLALGFALLFTSYLVYAHYLGGIDGLPPLPETCLPSPEPIDPPERRRTFVEQRLAQAFGEGCPELKRIIKLEIHANGVVLSTDDFHIMKAGELDANGHEREGQVRLQPLSLALFSKKTPPGQYPEITTIQCKTAYIAFDRPIVNMADMPKAKIVGAELIEDIKVVNNHRKPRNCDDELFIQIAKGPVFS